MGQVKHRFDRAYYRRYYLDTHTRVAEPAYYRRLAKFIGAYSDLLDIPVRSMLDIGCGTGALQKPLSAQFKRADYVGIDDSAYACEQYGWIKACASDFVSDRRFDLVICHDVMQYLNDANALKAIKNFARLSTKLVYFSVLTKEDWRRNVDQRLTDGEVFLRPANWYRRLLKSNFRNLGGGLYLANNSDAVVYALEADI